MSVFWPHTQSGGGVGSVRIMVGQILPPGQQLFLMCARRIYTLHLSKCFTLLRVTADLESIPGTLVLKREYTLDGMMFYNKEHVHIRL